MSLRYCERSALLVVGGVGLGVPDSGDVAVEVAKVVVVGAGVGEEVGDGEEIVDRDGVGLSHGRPQVNVSLGVWHGSPLRLYTMVQP